MQQGYINALFLLTILNLVAGAASVASAILAFQVLRDRGRQQATVDSKVPGKDLLLLRDSDRILGHETPTEARTIQRVRRSPLLSAEGRRDFFNG